MQRSLAEVEIDHLYIQYNREDDRSLFRLSIRDVRAYNLSYTLELSFDLNLESYWLFVNNEEISRRRIDGYWAGISSVTLGNCH